MIQGTEQAPPSYRCSDRHRNATASEYPRERCVHELFEQQVERTPEAVAVMFAGQPTTYAELNARANRLAARLVELGVGPEVLVGVCMDRSTELIVALLGILKAGGAYVPLDPSYPQARLAFMLADAAAPVLLTQQGLLERLPEYTGTLLCLDRDWPSIAAGSPENRPTRASPDALAYVIYTSGSTGRPKGVMIEHRPLVNHMAWMQRQFPLQAADRLLLKTSISADASVWELFAAFMDGACLVVAEPGAQRSPDAIRSIIQRDRINVLQLVPSMLDAMLDGPGLRGCTSLRRLYCGGEQLSRSLVRRFREQNDAEVVNLYGPTEATIDATFCVCEDLADGSAVPIGFPIANTRVHLLDDEGAEVPDGEAGEICIGGEGLARGYLNQPELTRQRFVDDRRSPVPGSRLYRTGDLGRVRDDGRIEFLGRIDHQIKIRGIRIEPGEVESVIAQDPAVRQVVVLARADAGLDSRLVAYVVPALERCPEIPALQALAREHLPEAMRPAAYVVLERLPLTPNGKLDRNALPAPEYGRNARDEKFVAPRNELEERIAAIWREVLGIPDIGVTDDFTDLGGHSLLAAKIVWRIAEVTRVDLPLQEFFAAPTVAQLADEVERAVAAGMQHPGEAVAPAPRNDGMPLSFGQQRLWFLDRLWRDSALYSIRLAWRLSGRIDATALGRALRVLIERHEILRTTFPARDGQVLQVIAEAVTGGTVIGEAGTGEAPADMFVESNLAALSEDEREARVASLLRSPPHPPFDIETGRLLRVSLLRLRDHESVLVLDVHHIVFDGWSTSVFERELSVAYQAALHGMQPDLPPLPIQYADYASWQRGAAQRAEQDRQLRYWLDRLSGLATLDLPTDRARPRSMSRRGARVESDLPDTLLHSLRRLAREERATLYMILLAAFQALMHRCSGQTDIAVGSPVDGRSRSEFEHLIGMFVNTVVLRTQVSGSTTFRQLLRAARDTAIGALSHADVPFERLVEALAPKRDALRNPLFQVGFAYLSAAPDVLALAGTEVAPLRPGGHTSKFDLSLELQELPAGMQGTWEYSTDLFDHETIVRMASHFQALLEGVVHDPDRPLDRIPVLATDERETILSRWNATSREYPRERCVHELFEQQVERTPEAVAVMFAGQPTTYAELNARANRLAARLVELGVGPEVLVGVCMDRSSELIVALLGILKAGGAYVPLDPSYPQARLAFMLADAAAPVLLTQKGLLERLPEYTGTLLCLDRDWPSIAAGSPDNRPTRASPDALAYVMYTSGSTGEPKGVAVPHRAVVRLVQGQNYVTLNASEVIAQVSNASFDAATFEIWGTLLNGARLAIVDRDDVLDPARLAAALARQEVTCLFLTTALFHRVSRLPPRALAGVRQLLFGGETCEPALVRGFLAAGFAGQLLHVYGPTETTTFATFHPVRTVEPDQPRIPVGRPIANTRVYILDDHLEPVPVGIAGMLYVAGDGVACGYWRRPALTAECFVPDPHARSPGERMYRTGDSARWLATGDIEFLGRSDGQIKLRGFRIEPGEVEAAIVALGVAKEVAVLAPVDAQGERHLVAYLVADGPADIDLRRLRAALRERLPEYMVPTRFATLPALPLTANGKVDVRALAGRPAEAAPAPGPGVGPRDAVERTLCRIWEDVLGGGPVHLDDNFFDRGGHSLLAADLFARQDRAFGRSLSIATLFEAPTVRALADRYRGGPPVAASGALVAIHGAGSLPPIFSVPGVNGNVVCFAELSGALGRDQPFYGLQSLGLDGACEPLETIEAIASHNLIAIRALQPNGPYHLIGACFGAIVALEMARQLLEDRETVGFLGLLDPASLCSEATPGPPVAVPRRWKRSGALARFAASRARTYLEEFQALSLPGKTRFLGRKLGMIGKALRQRDLLRGDHREFNQRRVHDANFGALLRYRFRPPVRASVTLDVFGTERLFDATTGTSCVDWSALTGLPVRYHNASGRDSGDMLTRPHVQELAAQIARCRAARNATPAADATLGAPCDTGSEARLT